MSKNPPKLEKTEVFNRLMQMTVNSVLSRTSTIPWLKRRMGTTLDENPNRNLDKECGYIEGDPTVQQYRLMVDEEGVAQRIVAAMADECWGTYPELYQTEEDRYTAFERAWDDMVEEMDPWHYFHRVDELSGIGHFGVLLIGLDDGMPLNKIAEGINEKGESTTKSAEKFRKVTYMRPFSEDLVTIQEFVTNPTNPRYGQPLYYQIRMSDPRNPSSTGPAEGASQFKDEIVHWSRVLHVADNCKSSEVYGVPRLKNLHRRVYDIRKILGGSGEMFYKGGFPGYSFETDPNVTELADIDLDSLKAEIQAYSDGLQRYMRLVGMSAKSLAPQVADPTSHLVQQYQYICSTIGMPLKVFLGSESGKMSSQEDRFQWNGKIARRQRLYLVPRMIKPGVRRLMMLGCLPKTPNMHFMCNWKDLNALSDKDKADRALKLAQALLQYVTSGSSHLITPKMFFTLILQMTNKEADAIIKAAGGEDAIMKEVKKLSDPMAGNTPNSTNTNPTARTGASGRRNGLGRAK